MMNWMRPEPVEATTASVGLGLYAVTKHEGELFFIAALPRAGSAEVRALSPGCPVLLGRSDDGQGWTVRDG
jgi:hypothetical protein